MDFRKFWPTLIPVLALLIEAFSGAFQQYLAQHPSISLLVVSIVTAIANAVRPTKA